jgi:hypothetical protein
MTPPDPTPDPRRHLLAGHADGELDAATRARVEAWLDADPDARAEWEAQIRLGPRGPLWEASAAPAPGPEAWDRVAAGVRKSLARRRPRRTPAFGVWAAVAAAAAFAALVPRGPVEAPWPVTSADDVEILSVQHDDAGLLVVGAPPDLGPLTLVSANDVHLINIEADDEGTMPMVQWPDAPDAPMVVAPVVRDQ